jgi:small subunit ribosomal protein S2
MSEHPDDTEEGFDADADVDDSGDEPESAPDEGAAGTDTQPESGGQVAETPPASDDADAAADATPALDEDVLSGEEADLLIPVEDYLGAGVHIGTQQSTDDMERYIHRVRTDGLYVLDVSATDDRIRMAAEFLSTYDPDQILVTSSRQYGRYPAEQFARAVGARARTGRFIPGTLTNPEYDAYIEPDVLVVTDPIGDSQVVKEANTVGIPVIAMCDSNNTTRDVDLVVPTNNKGRKALAVVYWLLANETLDARGADPTYGLDDFEGGI